MLISELAPSQYLILFFLHTSIKQQSSGFGRAGPHQTLGNHSLAGARWAVQQQVSVRRSVFLGVPRCHGQRYHL